MDGKKIIMQNGSTIMMEAGESLRSCGMITLAHKYSDWATPIPQHEDEIVCVKVKIPEQHPTQIFMISSPGNPKGYF